MHQRRLTPEARVYAIGELARRAGVDAADFQEWSVEIRQRETRVRLGRNSTKEIVFPFNEVDIFACSRFSWPFENDRINELLPNFVVPHVRPLQAVGQPLFALAGDVAPFAVDFCASAGMVANSARNAPKSKPRYRSNWVAVSTSSDSGFRSPAATT